MTDALMARPYLIAFIAGAAAQVVKVLSFLILEKKVNLRRVAETDGSPNMHSAAFSALTLAVGFLEGFDSLLFTICLCLTAMVSVDIWNVKRATSRHAELIHLILERLSKREGDFALSRRVLSYTPVDVLSGAALGVVITLLVV